MTWRNYVILILLLIIYLQLVMMRGMGNAWHREAWSWRGVRRTPDLSPPQSLAPRIHWGWLLVPVAFGVLVVWRVW